MKLPFLITALAATLLAVASDALGFCGFYVAKADTKLFNHASKVVLVRQEDKTVLTMVNDFEGDAKDFAVVIPVPTFLEKGQIHVGNQATVEHLDAYSAPRLVEYWDEDPCTRPAPMVMKSATARGGAALDSAKEAAAALGVKVEAQYTVGEYDIVLLSAEQSDGLQTWLTGNGYKIPAGAGEILGSYIKQNMHFFVAKVNLAEKAKAGFNFLRPIQVAYESPKFMLPIRLGMINSDGPQELFVFALTETGRVETTNYRTIKLPTGMDVPVYVKDTFPDFYRAMFDQQVKANDMKGVFEEYAWDMGWCDPCAAEPLSAEELRSLGVFWLEDASRPTAGPSNRRLPIPMPPIRPVPGSAQNVFVTRLHLRYDNAHFPEDLVFQETGDRTNFQGRYVLRHPWTGEAKCEAGKEYLAKLPEREQTEAHALADLTGWKLADIYGKMGLPAEGPASAPGEKKWYEKLWD
jgi:hypothetical protein